MKKKCAFCAAIYAEEELFCPECAGLVYDLIDDAQETEDRLPETAEQEQRVGRQQTQPEAEPEAELEAEPERELEEELEEEPEPETAPEQTRLPADENELTHAGMDERRKKLKRLQMMVWHKTDSPKLNKGMGKGELRFEKVGVVYHWQFNRALGFSVRWVPRTKKEVHFLYSDIRRAEMIKISGTTPILVLRMKDGKVYSFSGIVPIAVIQETADVINDYIALNEQK